MVRAGKKLTLSVALTDRAGNLVYDCRTLTVEAAEWERYEIELTPHAADPNADIRIYWDEEGAACFGALSLMPKDNFRGMRRDVIEKMGEMGIKVLRWPGGNFAGEYNWMDGLLPVDMRAPFQSYLGLETQPHTMGYDYHEINTDDFSGGAFGENCCRSWEKLSPGQPAEKTATKKAGYTSPSGWAGAGEPSSRALQYLPVR